MSESQPKEKSKAGRWQFFIDRGGTFTDIVARRPDGSLVVHKILSENPEHYGDAALQGMRDLMGVAVDAPLGQDAIEAVKMGTTVATNALLERKGERTVLVITKGFADALRIAYQNRPDIFARRIVLPEMLYESVIEVDERVTAQGQELAKPDLAAVERDLARALDAGIRSCAIVLMHAYRAGDHERQVADIARAMGFAQVSVSHEVSPLMKIVSRGDTTVVDAYLSPIMRRYIESVAAHMSGTRILFMQSNGGLAEARHFQGKDSILSGPAGGVVGAVAASARAGFQKIISFDMGGTSTDVAHFAGELERSFDTEIAGVRLRVPVMSINTVAAGGGSILRFDGQRYRVGPDSAGANPGPACYLRGGPLTVTDANVMVGKIQAHDFPCVFGHDGMQPISADIVEARFAEMACQIKEATGFDKQAVEVAEGFLQVAVERMASAIKKVSVQRGYNITDYTLCSFGGAGGQHACAIAASLGIDTVFIHPYAGVLSAYGIGLAALRALRERTIEAPLAHDTASGLEQVFFALSESASAELESQLVPRANIVITRKAQIKYEGTDCALSVPAGTIAQMETSFAQAHETRYGFYAPQKALIVESVSVEAEGRALDAPVMGEALASGKTASQMRVVKMFSQGSWHDTPVYKRGDLPPGFKTEGPVIIVEPTGTNVVERGWQAEVAAEGNLVLSRLAEAQSPSAHRKSEVPVTPDPVMLEIFNNLFMSTAEQMGLTLQNTSYSVNIKERLDFSCAVFDRQGNLVANAPHIPVHLGSMGESVRTIMLSRKASMKPGDVYVLNNPYNGGTHLPDVTVVTPVFDDGGDLLFFVASRGHHADIGGITPGSMPPASTTIEEEGVLIDDFQLVGSHVFREKEISELLASGKYPCRNIAQNIGDLRAQIAANEKGARELRKMVSEFGLPTVNAYMRFVQENAAHCVRNVIGALTDGSFRYPMDDGSDIAVSISVDRDARRARIDFQGTADQQKTNFNAPSAVCKAAVLYVFRTLVDDEIPLNAGCLEPIEIVIPDGSLLSPHHPAAVVAGNVETSQAVTDCLYGALGLLAASQGTMNNLTFGDDRYQYYETICGGAGAGADFDGASAVHTHMTNSRLTDPEVLEFRFPVLLEDFRIRHGSGGQGARRGGDGVIRRLRFLAPMTAAVLSTRRLVPPFGLGGGLAGQAGKNLIIRKDGSKEILPGTFATGMQAGDVLVIETPGGGGYGKPLS